MRPSGARSARPAAVAALAILALAACDTQVGTFDPDLRRLGGGFNTADAAATVQTETRPQADARGILSYPGYQVAVARSGDTVADVAARVGLPPDDLARHNGLPLDATLRSGEIVALPRRVGNAVPATGLAGAGPITSAPATPGSVDITTLASTAIDRAGTDGGSAAAPPLAAGTQPEQHQVTRGETAFTIARSYGVSVEALAQWNGLDAQFNVREGQYLLIPPVMSRTAAAAAPIEPPGSGSALPPPPSASQPLPPPPTPAPAPPATPATPTTRATPAAQFAMPVQGPIIRAFARGRNDGIDIGAPAGTPVRAAEAGSVVVINENTEGVIIVVIRHADGLLTIYAGVDDVTVSRGTSVTRGQQIAVVRAAPTPFLHFEVRRGTEALDPSPFLE